MIPRTRKTYLDIFVTGILVIGLTNAFLYAGQQYATSAVAAVLMALNPVLAGGFAWVLLPKERPDAIGTTGLLLGLIGIGITAGFRPSTLLAGEIRQFYLLVAAACIALGSVISRRVNAPQSAISTTGWGMLFGGILLHLGSLALSEPVSFASDVWTPSLWISVTYVGVIATGGAYPAYFTILGEIGPVKTNLVSYGAPLVAAVVGWLILRETIELTTVVGFLVVVTGFILVNHRAVVREIRDIISACAVDKSRWRS